MGKPEQAEHYHQEALKIRKMQLGAKHVDVATSYDNLGHAYDEFGGKSSQIQPRILMKEQK